MCQRTKLFFDRILSLTIVLSAGWNSKRSVLPNAKGNLSTPRNRGQRISRVAASNRVEGSGVCLSPRPTNPSCLTVRFINGAVLAS
jgi:hypothetical protein